jgi:hypothetical protein
MKMIIWKWPRCKGIEKKPPRTFFSQNLHVLPASINLSFGASSHNRSLRAEQVLANSKKKWHCLRFSKNSHPPTNAKAEKPPGLEAAQKVSGPLSQLTRPFFIFVCASQVPWKSETAVLRYLSRISESKQWITVEKGEIYPFNAFVLFLSRGIISLEYSADEFCSVSIWRWYVWLHNHVLGL